MFLSDFVPAHKRLISSKEEQVSSWILLLIFCDLLQRRIDNLTKEKDELSKENENLSKQTEELKANAGW